MVLGQGRVRSAEGERKKMEKENEKNIYVNI